MASMNSILVDDSLWPLVVTRCGAQPSTREQQAYFSRMLDYLRREEKCVAILDTRLARMTTAEHRKNLADFMREHQALIRTQLLGCAVVIASPVHQLATSLVIHLTTPPAPYFLTTSLSEAAKWAAKCLEGAGRPLDAERIRYHYAPPLQQHVG